MKTKHLILSLFAFMAALLTSCTDKETVAGTEANGTKTVTFNVTTDAQTQTRAGIPGVTGYKLNYVLQVLDASGNPVTEAAQNNQTGTFTVSLPVGATYTCLFWADFIPDSGSSATDNEYFTTTDLKAVALKQALTGDDQCQAFCGTASIAADQVEATTTVVLKRAVAQVNLRSTAEMKGFSKLEAKYTDVPNTFNVLDNTTSVSGTTGIAPNFTVTDLSVATGDNNFTFQSAYFLAPGTEDANMVKIELKTYNSSNPSTPLETLTIANVPTKKNYKTNVKGAFKPATVDHTYTIDFGEWGTDVDYTPVSKWDGSPSVADPSATFGGGTGDNEKDPYIIAKAADLAQLAANVDAGTSYSAKYFKLTTDIDLDNKEWTPIGISTNAFQGHFNGDFYKISNLNLNSTTETTAGLFGVLSGGSIKNLQVSGNIVNTNSAIRYFGGICGMLDNTGKIISCSFEGSISCAAFYTGGICGAAQLNENKENKTTICASKNSGNITSTSESARVGGIVGCSMTSFVNNCYNEGEIKGADYVGGIAGGIQDSGANMEYCYNTGNIICTNDASDYVGAISGDDEGRITVESYAKMSYKKTLSNNSEKIFGSSAWPTWTAGADADGTDGKGYWKSLGGWNGGAPTYPTLWWE